MNPDLTAGLAPGACISFKNHNSENRIQLGTKQKSRALTPDSF
jgi:hypothetical protein